MLITGTGMARKDTRSQPQRKWNRKQWRRTGSSSLSAHLTVGSCSHQLTNKDSIERNASKMIGCNQDVYARSLDAIWGWTSPGASLAFRSEERHVGKEC